MPDHPTTATEIRIRVGRNAELVRFRHHRRMVGEAKLSWLSANATSSVQ
jgi:hypothetical protein